MHVQVGWLNCARIDSVRPASHGDSHPQPYSRQGLVQAQDRNTHMMQQNSFYPPMLAKWLMQRMLNRTLNVNAESHATAYVKDRNTLQFCCVQLSSAVTARFLCTHEEGLVNIAAAILAVFICRLLTSRPACGCWAASCGGLDSSCLAAYSALETSSPMGTGASSLVPAGVADHALETKTNTDLQHARTVVNKFESMSETLYRHGLS